MLSPDITLCGLLGSKHQLTQFLYGLVRGNKHSKDTLIFVHWVGEIKGNIHRFQFKTTPCWFYVELFNSVLLMMINGTGCKTEEHAVQYCGSPSACSSLYAQFWMGVSAYWCCPRNTRWKRLLAAIWKYVILYRIYILYFQFCLLPLMIFGF